MFSTMDEKKVKSSAELEDQGIICSEQILVPVITSLGHKDARALARACCLCRAFNAAGSAGPLWKEICRARWPDIPLEGLATLVTFVGGFKKLYAVPRYLEVVSFKCTKEVQAILPGRGAGLGIFIKRVPFLLSLNKLSPGLILAPAAKPFDVAEFGWGVVSEDQVQKNAAKPGVGKELYPFHMREFIEGFGTVWDLNMEVKRSVLSGYEITRGVTSHFDRATKHSSEVPFKLPGCEIHRKPKRRQGFAGEEAELYVFPIEK
ncbi:hypothetical protein KFL_000870030 [Klebsormidium nitens]|uniref:F-box domain-containing protein n=1 Tax=Klebsormidium nitens TaxID=105231 RepID=A0A1Y1I0N9_KLENI|nr:hypothetical protein KFL_000870030 [Klebsormidium nitens]|eukprot:GAQ81668.1 hypothetical protein KFL_000870030 [Klebsormidium nitens]